MNTLTKNEILAQLTLPLNLVTPNADFDPNVVSAAIQERLNTVFGPFGWDQEFTEVFDGSKLFALKCTLSVQIAKSDTEFTVYKKQQITSIDSDTTNLYEKLFIKTATLFGINAYTTKSTASPTINNSSSTEPLKIEQPAVEHSAPVVAATETSANPAEETIQPPPVIETPVQVTPVTDEIATPATKEVKDATPPLTAKEILSSRAGAHEPIKPGVHVKQEVTPPPQEPATQEPEVLEEKLTDETIVTLPEAEKKLVQELIQKLETVPPSIVKTYITGPRVQDRLSERSKKYLLEKIDAKQAK